MDEDHHDLSNTTLLIPTFLAAIQTHLQEKSQKSGELQEFNFSHSSFPDLSGSSPLPSPQWSIRKEAARNLSGEFDFQKEEINSDPILEINSNANSPNSLQNNSTATQQRGAHIPESQNLSKSGEFSSSLDFTFNLNSTQIDNNNIRNTSTTVTNSTNSTNSTSTIATNSTSTIATNSTNSTSTIATNSTSTIATNSTSTIATNSTNSTSTIATNSTRADPFDFQIHTAEKNFQPDINDMLIQETSELLDLVGRLLSRDLKSHLHSTQKNSATDQSTFGPYLSASSIHNIKNEMIVKCEKDDLVHRFLELVILQLQGWAPAIVRKFLAFSTTGVERTAGGFSTEASLHALIFWLNIHQSYSHSANLGHTFPVVSTLFKDKKAIERICDTIQTMLDLIARTHPGACFLLGICQALLKEQSRQSNDDPSQWGVIALTKKLIINKQLAHYFAIKLGGALFLYEQFHLAQQQQSQEQDSRSPVSQAIFSDIVTKGLQPSADQLASTTVSTASSTVVPAPTPVPNNSTLQSLNHLSTVLKKDAVLSRLLKDSGLSSPCIWIYNFQKEKEKEHQVTVEFSLPRDVALQEITIHAMQHYLISSGSSLFPPVVAFETGSSLERMLPCGRLLCEADPSMMASSRCYTSTFKFILPSAEVSRFVRMRFFCPGQSTWIAISRIQLRGYSLDSQISLENNRHPLPFDLSVTTRMPSAISIDLLAHCIRFPNVAAELLELPNIEERSCQFLTKVSQETAPFIEDILSNLSLNSKLCTLFLKKTLDYGHSAFYASIAARLCSIRDNSTKARLQLLADFIFRQLQRAVMPIALKQFLLALSSSIWANPEEASQLHFDKEFFELLFSKTANMIRNSPTQEACITLLVVILQLSPVHFEDLLDKVMPTNKEHLLQLLQQSADAFFIIANLISSSEFLARTFIESRLAPLLVKLVSEIDLAQLDATGLQVLQQIIPFLQPIATNPLIKTWIGSHLLPALVRLSTTTLEVAQDLLEVIETCISFHPQNQARLVTLLTDSAPDRILERLGPLNLQLLARLFEFRDSIYVSFGREVQLGHKKNELKFDYLLSDPNIQFDPQMKAATCNATAKWSTALTAEPLSSGVHRWEILIEKCTSTCNIMIGVSEKAHAVGQFVGMDATSWSFYGCNGYAYHAGLSKSYGARLRQGDSLVVELDMNAGTLSFVKASYSFGIAFSGLEGRALYPSVSLYDIGDTVSVISTQLSSDQDLSLGQYRVDLNCPLKHSKVHSIFKFAADFPVIDLGPDLLGPQLFERLEKVGNAIKFDHLMKHLPESYKRSAIIESSVLYSQIEPCLTASTRPTPPPVVHEIVVQEKLSFLVSLLQVAVSENSVHSLWSNEYDQRPQEWLRFLRQLQVFLKIEGFAMAFAQSSECRAMIIHLLKLLRAVILDQPAFSANFRKALPAHCDPLYSAFFSLLSPQTVQREDSNVNSNSDTSNSDTSNSNTSNSNPNSNPNPNSNSNSNPKPKSNPKSNPNSNPNSNPKVQEEIRISAFKLGIIKKILKHLSALSAVAPQNPKVFSQKTSRENKAQKKEDRTFWARGTGFGTGTEEAKTQGWSQSEYSKQQEVKAKKVSEIVRGLSTYLAVKSDNTVPTLLVDLLKDSCLLPFLSTNLRNDSILDIFKFMDLHLAIFALLRTLASHSDLISLLVTELDIMSLIEKLDVLANSISKALQKSKSLITALTPIKKPLERDPFTTPTNTPPSNTPEPSPQKVTLSSEQEEFLVSEITKTTRFVLHKLKLFRERQQILQLRLDHQPSSRMALPTSAELEFAQVIKPLQFSECSLRSENVYVHHYSQKFETTAPPQKIKRLIREIGSLNTGLPLSLASTIFFVVDDERIDVMKALITGPTGTPYAHGMFEFDIYCPADYPNSPPLVNFQTTRGGSVRFNPNLYNCGKVCLSLLGTWRGSETEKWNPNTSTLLQILVSIQSLIFVEEPYFNEPGYEIEMGTAQGSRESREYSDSIQVATMRYAITDQLRNPSFGFSQVVQTYATLKRNEIFRTCAQWVKVAKDSNSNYKNKMETAFLEMVQELEKLGPIQREERASEINNNAEGSNSASAELAATSEVSKLSEMFPSVPLETIVKTLNVANNPEHAVSLLLEQTK